jgi:dihydroorotate dehydrogenase
MYALVKKILFLLPPEKAHAFAMGTCRFFQRLPGGASLLTRWFSHPDPSLARTVFGLEFPNPVGLAAGFDKDARYVDTLACLGFGFVEIGTVTPRPQPGNPRPRLFRLPKDQALINRMGFNNQGAAAAAARLAKTKSRIIIGGNIGKNKTTPNAEAEQDYEKCFEALYEVVDYFVVNVSSPNTPGLRHLQDKEPLRKLLLRLQARNRQKKQPRPMLLKIAPDLTDRQLDDIIAIATEAQLDGIVATNTTLSREGLMTSSEQVAACGAGGLSGKPLAHRSTEIIRYLHSHTAGRLAIIAVGGIFTAQDALEKLQAGASLVQVYTGFIYEGPAIAKHLCEGLRKAPQPAGAAQTA